MLSNTIEKLGGDRVLYKERGAVTIYNRKLQKKGLWEKNLFEFI